MYLSAADPSTDALRQAAQKSFDSGNFKEAWESFERLASNPDTDPKKVGDDLHMAIQSLQRLGRSDETDAFRDKVVEIHQSNWRLLHSAANSYLNGEHYGFVVAGEFQRGGRRSGQGGEYVSSVERDRVLGLRLLQQALPLIKDEADQNAVGDFYISFANSLMNGARRGAWRMQVLTNLEELPDYEPGYYRYGYGGQQGAPVDAEGNPIYHHTPESYEAAKSDGERWRWMLTQAIEASPRRANEVKLSFANFLHQQFGVRTMASVGYAFGRRGGADASKPESGTFALHTLGEGETIARLATGVKRFDLPDEFNFIKIYQEMAANGKSNGGEQALAQLAGLFSDRRQYPKAANCWKQSIAQYGPGTNNYKQHALDQIIKNWGTFENVTVQPAGTGATVDYRFRNGSHVSFEAHEIRVEKLLTDVKTYLKSNPAQIDWQKINVSNIGYRLVAENESAYLGSKVANWELALTPEADHFDSRVTVSTPLQKSGAYLLTGKMKDGNTSRVVIWISDTVIAKKQIQGGAYYFVADAVTGRPIPKANLEFFGWQQKNIGRNKYQVLTENFAEFTDNNGQVIPTAKQMPNNYQWIVIARDGDKRFSFLGFSGVWYGNRYDPEYNQTKVFAITDRPVYRPNQTVKFKFWVRKAQYDQADTSKFANQSFTVRINNPKGEEVQKKTYKTDEYGGFEGEFSLGEEPTLGQYGIYIVDHPNVGGGGSFRVEEYKKPEYEVTIEAPSEPVMLGEKIAATIQAKYYFGAPVTHAKVKYKVERTSYSEQWYPVGRWDWFYGKGYWWFAPDYAWYPGWSEWGCLRPFPMWWPQPHQPPELVAEQEVEIGADGKLSVEIDTAVAREMHGDQDHKYTITAEVVDASRRTIVGTGNVLVARKPFKVFAWVDRGHYRAGDAILSQFSAHTLDKKPVEGTGKLTLLRITYDADQKPVETPVQTWDLDTNAQGEARQQITAAKPGQYRLSYTLTDAKKHSIEGGYLFVVRGDDFQGEEFRFNDLELITDKREYTPGETVRLMINTDRTDGTVVLFLRPTNGVYLPPKVIRLTGKSMVEDILVVKKDMPNFFVEAITVSNGQLFSETREIIVPPEQRVLNVSVTPSAAQFLPGAPASVIVKLTDAAGKPFVGSTVMTIYDKSVEYISGGSNVPEIREFFWKWRRNHYPRTEHNLAWSFGNLLKRGEAGMSFLGAFGATVADELAKSSEKEEHAATGTKKGYRQAGAAKRLRQGNAMLESDRRDADKKPADGEEGGASDNLVEPTVRRNFADTAYWTASLITNAEGIAEVSLKMPENLTGWKIKTWAMGQGTKVGEGESEVVTAKNLLVRMQAPRFFVEKDEVVLSANVHNYLKVEKNVQVVLELDGNNLLPTGSLVQQITVPANGEQRVDWRVRVAELGEAVVRMKALTDEESDAMEMRFPVFVHGMLKTDSFTGVIRPNQTASAVSFTVPNERRINESRLEVRYSPSLAGAMVDALPYLVSYPHKTTDTTLARFLPTVITQKILLRMKLDLKTIQEKRINLNAQEIGDDAERAAQWKRYDHNPVFDEAEVAAMVKDGVKALTEMQLSDGGWGWFSGYGEHSYPHTTAVVVHGLQIAGQNDVALVPGVLENGVAWLKRYQAEQVKRLKNAPTKTKPWKESADNLDSLVYMVLVDADVADAEMLEFLYRDRTNLAVYALTTYGLALQKQGQQEKLAMVLRNIDQYLVEDDENQTAYLKLPENNYWWYWYGSDTEANAYYLKLLCRTEPKGEKASRLVKYLLNNRKHASYWNSTRDTALCIEALAEFLVASGEDRPDMVIEVYLDGRLQKEVEVHVENLFSFDNKFVLTGDALEAGQHRLELKRKGSGPVYYNAYVTNFSLEDFITKAGLEIKVNRKFYKLVRDDRTIQVSGSRGQVVDQKKERYIREELPNLSTLKSGDLVEIELEIDSKNDYEYLIFEDMKAAGFEPVDLQSGYNGNNLGAYMELRDERVTFFARTLARGKHSVSYRLRAEIPGRFSALPAKGHGVYAPELKANSDELKISVTD